MKFPGKLDFGTQYGLAAALTALIDFKNRPVGIA